MESLAYIHQSLAYSDSQSAPKVVLWQRLNWQKPPSSAWLKFLWLSVIITAVVAISETAQAATVQVKTNSGYGVYVRPQPTTSVAQIGGLSEGAIVNAQPSGTPGWYVITSGTYKDAYIDGKWTVPVSGITGGTGNVPRGAVSGTKFQVKTNSGIGVKVRTAPGGTVMGGIGEGGTIDAQPSGTAGWYVITSGAYAGGYVSDSWLVKSGGDYIAGDVGFNGEAAAGLYAVKTNSGIGVKVRTAPGGTVMGGIGEGGTIDAQPSDTAGWYVITSGAYAGGYVSDSWLVKSGGGYMNGGSGFNGGTAGLYAVKTNSGIGVKVRTAPGGTVMGGIGDGGTVNAEPSGTAGWLVITSGAYAGGYISDSWAVPIL